MADALEPEILRPGTPPRDKNYPRRAAAAVGMLVLALAATVIGTIWLIGQDREGPWSPGFKATADDPVDRGAQVATYVEGRYFAAPGTPLNDIKTGEDVIPDLPFRDQFIALADDTQTTYSFEQRSLLIYKLCPTASSCELPADADRAALGPLYARQAIELALYGFRYVKEATGVVVELPTGYVPDIKDARFVHYFPKKDWEDELETPFAKTLPGNPPLPGAMSPAELDRISTLAAGTFFRMDVGPGPDNTYIIYKMTPPPPG